tara:strand:- start:4557 stop:5162 length:606 start_codon:yes stop_codon:yes gene_type:complete
MICVIDYGCGNLNSIKNAIDRLNFQCEVSSNPKIISKSDKIILPGVGAFSTAIEKLKKNKLDTILSEEVLNKKKPILGICLGFQLMFSESYEFKKTKGLDWINGSVTKIDSDMRLPHNGWNTIKIFKENELIESNVEKFFYFNHSLSIKSNDDNFEVLGKTFYGEEFISMGKKNDNIFGIQPHPEKSQIAGLEFLKKFLKL